MKKMFIQAKSDIDILEVIKEALPKIKENIGLATTIQHLHNLEKAKVFLEKENKKVTIIGQTLGCKILNKENLKEEIEQYLYIGTGKFHPIQIYLETKKHVLVLNPETQEIKELDKKELELIEKKKKASLTKFYSSKNIGILVTTKPGQNRLKEALELKQKLIDKGKEAYIFIEDTLPLNELENFNFIECWINTACPRIADYESNILNIDDIGL